MKVISTNIAQPQEIQWRGKKIQTGIYKKTVHEGIFLGKEEVTNDTVVDRKHHGGEYKSCYMFGANYYEDWKKKYPSLDWEWGMFGENLTIDSLDENLLQIGAVYELGEALVQITEPRQPCFKLGIKFGTQSVIKEFLEYGHPGTYVKILNEGSVVKGDTLILKETGPNALTVMQYNDLVNQKEKDKKLLALALANDCIRTENRERYKKYESKHP